MEWINVLILSSLTTVLASPIITDVTVNIALLCASSIISFITLGLNLSIYYLLSKNFLHEKIQIKKEKPMDFSKFRTNDPIIDHVTENQDLYSVENNEENEEENEEESDEVQDIDFLDKNKNVDSISITESTDEFTDEEVEDSEYETDDEFIQLPPELNLKTE